MTRILTREELLGPHHEPFTCPDAGKLLILPYISLGAIEGYLAIKDDPRAAFAELFSRSIGDNGPDFESLSADDCGAIATFLARSADFEDIYAELSFDCGVFEAFYEALTNSESYERHVRHNDSLARHVRLIESQYLQISNPFQDLDHALNRIRPILSTKISQQYFQEDISFGFNAYRGLADGVLARVHELDILSTKLTNGMDVWGKFSRQQKTVTDAYEKLDSGLARFVDRVQRVQTILKPVDDIHRTVISVSEQIRATSRLSTDVLKLADSAVDRCRFIVSETNGHFSEPTETESPVSPSGLPPATADAYGDVADAAQASELLRRCRRSRAVCQPGLKLRSPVTPIRSTFRARAAISSTASERVPSSRTIPTLSCIMSCSSNCT